MYGLSVNKEKTNIITDIKDLKDVKEIEGIKVTNSFKYLGMKISCDRKKVVDVAKNNCSKFLHILRGKLNSSNEELTALIYGAFHRSLAIYYFTPLFSAGLITRD